MRALQKAYPAGFAPLPGYRVECLSLEGDALCGVLWRSAAERALMFSIPGWREEGKGKEEFHPLQDFCKHWFPEAEEMECLDLLENTQRPLAWKLEQVARRLDCSPTVSGVQEALAKRLLRPFPDDAGECLQNFAVDFALPTSQMQSPSRSALPGARLCRPARYSSDAGRLCRSPATRRIYASKFCTPQCHGPTRTHFPPRPHKSQWHCDITNVLWPHGLSTH